ASEDVRRGSAEARVRREKEADGVLRPDDQVGMRRDDATGRVGESPEGILRARCIDPPRVGDVARYECDADERSLRVVHAPEPDRAVADRESEQYRCDAERRHRLASRSDEELADRGTGRREDEGDKEG